MPWVHVHETSEPNEPGDLHQLSIKGAIVAGVASVVVMLL